MTTTPSQDPVREALRTRITSYLSAGGLFNPELADHRAVRDLLIECRDALAATPARPQAGEALREALAWYANASRYDYDQTCCYDGSCKDGGVLDDGGERARSALAHPTEAAPAADWYCEKHMDKPMGHGGCDEAGIPPEARIHRLQNFLRLARQRIRETEMARDDLAAQLRNAVAAPAAVPVQQAWEWAGGNPGITATPDMLREALQQLDKVCDEAAASKGAAVQGEVRAQIIEECARACEAWGGFKDGYSCASGLRALAASAPVQPVGEREYQISAGYFPAKGEVDLTWQRASDGAICAVTLKVTPEQGEKICEVVWPCQHYSAEAVQPVAGEGLE